MQKIIIDQPYEFVPPANGEFWPFILRQFVRGRLRREFGIVEVKVRGLEHLQASITSGAGILIAPNHSHPADPFVLIEIGRQLRFSPYIMASWHLFMQGKLQRWVLRHGRVFSVYREGLDRQALTQAIEILDQGSAPLVIFPEGVISRHNDRLNPLMDGVSLIAKSAAKKRNARSAGAGVVVHPVALKYDFQGDVDSTLAPTLSKIEQRLTWRAQTGVPTKDRIIKFGSALLALKEIEHFGEAQPGTIAQRVEKLIDRLLVPLEAEWLGGKRDGGNVARIKKLRSTVLPDLIQGDLPESERARRWRQLEDMYLAQQLHSYPPDYLSEANGLSETQSGLSDTDKRISEKVTRNRMIETVERFEEDMTDICTIYRPRTVSVIIGEAIQVGIGPVGGVEPGAKRGAGVIDQVEIRLLEMLKD